MNDKGRVEGPYQPYQMTLSKILAITHERIFVGLCRMLLTSQFLIMA